MFLASCSDKVILCGDPNCKGPDGTEVDDGLALLLSSLGLEHMIHMLTRGSALLDVLASDAPDIFTDVHFIDAGLCTITVYFWSAVPSTDGRRELHRPPTGISKRSTSNIFRLLFATLQFFHLQKQLSIHLQSKLLLRSPRRSTKLPLLELATDDCQRQRLND